MSNTFIPDVLKLFSGAVIAQVIGILLIPIITRLYSPTDFGLITLILSITAIFAIFSCLSYQLAIMLPQDNGDAANITAFCCTLVIISSIITGVVFFLFADQVAYAINAPEIAPYFVFIPLLVFFTALFSVFTYWTSRRKRFGIYAIAQVANSLSNKIVQIVMGIGAASLIGLIAGVIIGYICGIIVMLKGFYQDLDLFKRVTKDRTKELAIRYKKFPLYTSWSTTANTISTQIAPLLLVYFYSPLVVGYFAIASQVIQMPMSLIGSAVGQVFFQKASEMKNVTGNITQIVHGVHRRLIAIGIFPMLLLMIIGEDLFAVVLGMQWYTAGMYAKILSPWLLLVFIASPLSTVFSILERQHIDLSFNITILLSRIGVLCIGGLFFNPIETLILFSLTGVIFWGWLNLYLLKISGIPYRIGVFEYFKFFGLGLALAVPLIIAKLLAMPAYMLFIVAGIVSFGYYAIILLNDSVLKNELLETLMEFKI